MTRPRSTNSNASVAISTRTTTASRIERFPATHATRGAFVARGSSRDEYAVYTEDSAAYKRNVDRLLKKWNTAKEIVPAPEFYAGK